MQEIFDKIPLEKFEDYLVTLRKEGHEKEADRLAFIIASIRYHQSLAK
jgi:hypothetical protein